MEVKSCAEFKSCADWPILKEEELNSKMADGNFVLWRVIVTDDNVKKLSRQFIAKNFVEAMSFLNKAAEVAESLQHHPGKIE
jgi:pterin-4a-carbinolamine dehydratase